MAAPTNGMRKIKPIDAPQKVPETAPTAVVLMSWFSLIFPLASFTAIVHRLIQRGILSACLVVFDNSSAFASVGNAITMRSLIGGSPRCGMKDDFGSKRDNCKDRQHLIIDFEVL